MDMKAYELGLRAFLGDETLTKEELDSVRERNVRYELVRFLVAEKLNNGNPKYKTMNFHFTPGSGFMETPIIDIVNSIINVKVSPEDLVLGASKGGAPFTGLEKRNINDIDF